MRLVTLLFLLLVPVAAAAQVPLRKPDPLPPVTAAPAPPQTGGKPLAQPPAGNPGGTVAPPAAGQAAPRCAPPLSSGCLSQQSSCQIACPPQWSTNPAAPAFTPNDRAGCMSRCMQRYLSCMTLYGCM
jgi:hypothetical protein